MIIGGIDTIMFFSDGLLERREKRIQLARAEGQKQDYRVCRKTTENNEKR